MAHQARGYATGARELWVDAVNVGGPAPVAMPYHALLPAVRHSTTNPEPPPEPPPAGEGVTVQAPSLRSEPVMKW